MRNLKTKQRHLVSVISSVYSFLCKRMRKRWKYFLKNIKDDTLEFTVVIEELQAFLEPVFEAIVNEDEWQNSWDTAVTRWR